MSETNTQAAPVPPPLVRAHLFRRFVAYILDWIVLGVIGFLLSLPFSAIFYTLGQNGVWVGVVVALIYFTICQTSLTSGQTLGYKLLGLSVEKTNGSYLDLKEGLIRGALLTILFLGGSMLALFAPAYLGGANALAIVGIVFSSIFYVYYAVLLVFIVFHPLKRGIHDLAAQAVVVNRKQYNALSDSEKQEFLGQQVSIKRPKVISRVLVALIVIGTLIGIFVFNPFKIPFVSNLVNLQQQLNTIPGVYINSMKIEYSYQYSSDGQSQPVQQLQVGGIVDRATFTNVPKLNALADQVALQTAHVYPQINQVDQVTITLSTSYSIGIWNYGDSQYYQFSSQDLLKGIASSTPQEGSNFNF